MESSQQLEFKWNPNKIVDRTTFSKSGVSPIEFSDHNKTATRIERFIGDDYPSVRIFGDQSIVHHQTKSQNYTLEWNVKLEQSHGFVEVGIINNNNSVYFIKPGQNEFQSDNGLGESQTYQISGNKLSKKLGSGDTITVIAEFKYLDKKEQDGDQTPYLSLSFKAHGVLLDSPFSNISISNTSLDFYPMVGLNDGGDKISIV
eukprot:gene2489-3081_t